jgi:hypothetical protein
MSRFVCEDTPEMLRSPSSLCFFAVSLRLGLQNLTQNVRVSPLGWFLSIFVGTTNVEPH